MAVSARFPPIFQPAAGALAGLCGYALMMLLPRGPGAIAALVLWTAITLAAGERGFARWFPKLPLFGSLLAACTLLLRWYALIWLARLPHLSPLAIVAALALGPAAMIGFAWVSRPADELAFARLLPLTTWEALVAMAEGVAAAFLCGVRVGTVLVLVAWLLFRIVSWYVDLRFGGVRNSDLEGYRILVETASLMLVSSLAGVTSVASYH
jgi:hypothetical protein